MKPVAVIILNWNGRKLLKQFLPSVVKGTNKTIADVIVADNGSHDKSIDYINDNFPDVKIIRFEKNLGFAQGYNEAIKQTGYKYTLLLNNDVAVPEGWLEPLYDFMENNPTVGACQPKLLSYENRKMFEYAGASGGFIDRNGFPYCRGRIFSHVEHDHEQYDNTTTVFWASGAALMVRTELYNRVGGLDPLFFAHMEEI
ncbi:MAG: glycosyltransferase family 2 protein, partial [Bacteroidales bacterium]|nr:glycosyltransferase family 2 protein [Bacteroidales bacterium]